MSAGSLILVVATVVSVQAGTAQLDRGRQDGLEPGDRGRVYYQLTVAGNPKRIEVGSVAIASVEASSATLSIPTELTIRAGYRLEVEIPATRLDALKRPIKDEPPKRPASVPADEEEMKRPVSAPAEVAPATGVELIPALKEEADESPAEAPSTPATPPDLILIPAGRYAVGLDLAEAEFFSQTPRFIVELPSFWIDPRPSPRRDLNWAEAEAHCRQQGKRLPTEIEWEIAVQQSQVSARPGLLEWTASWYEPYPGNTRPEEQYGRQNRVLRGSPGTATPDPHARRYMAPGEHHADVGFRCALDLL